MSITQAEREAFFEEEYPYIKPNGGIVLKSTRTIPYDTQTQRDAARVVTDLEKSSRPESRESSRAGLPADPVRESADKRIADWNNGLKGCV